MFFFYCRFPRLFDYSNPQFIFSHQGRKQLPRFRDPILFPKLLPLLYSSFISRELHTEHANVTHYFGAPCFSSIASRMSETPRDLFFFCRCTEDRGCTKVRARGRQRETGRDRGEQGLAYPYVEIVRSFDPILIYSQVRRRIEGLPEVQVRRVLSEFSSSLARVIAVEMFDAFLRGVREICESFSGISYFLRSTKRLPTKKGNVAF